MNGDKNMSGVTTRVPRSSTMAGPQIDHFRRIRNLSVLRRFSVGEANPTGALFVVRVMNEYDRVSVGDMRGRTTMPLRALPHPEPDAAEWNRVRPWGRTRNA